METPPGRSVGLGCIAVACFLQSSRTARFGRTNVPSLSENEDCHPGRVLRSGAKRHGGSPSAGIHLAACASREMGPGSALVSAHWTGMTGLLVAQSIYS